MASGIRGAATSRLTGPAVLVGLVVAFAITSASGHGEQAHLAPAGPALGPGAAVPAAVDPVLDASRAVARWATFCGLLMVGALPFARLAVPERRDNRRILPIAVLGCGLCAIGALAGLLLFGPVALGLGAGALGDGDLVAASLGTSHGRLLALQAVAALLLAPVAARVLVAPGRAPARENLALCLGLVLVVAVAADGHAAAALVPAVAHTGAMALWLGSLLAAAALPAHRLGDAERREVPVLLSRLAPWCLIVVVASGLVLAWHAVPSPAGLWTSDYGRTLLLKLAVVALLLGAASVARSTVRRRWAPGAGEAPATPARGGAGALRAVVAAELALGICVLAVTSHLALHPPPAP